MQQIVILQKVTTAVTVEQAVLRPFLLVTFSAQDGYKNLSKLFLEPPGSGETDNMH
jgi:hypothetical protein